MPRSAPSAATSSSTTCTATCRSTRSAARSRRATTTAASTPHSISRDITAAGTIMSFTAEHGLGRHLPRHRRHPRPCERQHRLRRHHHPPRGRRARQYKINTVSGRLQLDATEITGLPRAAPTPAVTASSTSSGSSSGPTLSLATSPYCTRWTHDPRLRPWPPPAVPLTPSIPRDG